MQVYGEKFLFINGWMNLLSLCLAACLSRGRLRMGRAILASALGAGYAALAWSGPGWAREIPALLGAALLMAGVAFGPRCLRVTPLVFTAGWLLGGCADFLLSRGVEEAGTLALCGGMALTVCLIVRRPALPRMHQYALILSYRGKTARLPAMPDSGNLLADGFTGLPVIVVPAGKIGALLPPGTRPEDLSTLPRGFRILRVQTAAGSQAVMCFRPDGVLLARGKRQWRIDAAVAVSAFQEKRALLPAAIFEEKGEGYHASL